MISSTPDPTGVQVTVTVMVGSDLYQAQRWFHPNRRIGGTYAAIETEIELATETLLEGLPDDLD